MKESMCFTYYMEADKIVFAALYILLTMSVRCGQDLMQVLRNQGLTTILGAV